MPASTTSSITIAAPRQDVMAVIADFAAYPEWASGVRAADVVEEGEAGRARRVRFSLDAGLVKDTYVLGYDWDGDAGVRWQLAKPGAMVSGMSGGYLLADRGGGTEVTYQLTVDVRIPMPGMLRRRAEKMIIDTALRGLKSRAETRETRGGDGT
jgi:carbon monoxide dehydrogenase subunit G